MSATWRKLGLAAAVVAAAVPLTATGASAAGPASVVINEIQYHPAVDGQEFLELHNPGDDPFDLSGACFTSGIGGCFAPGSSLAAGGFVTVAESLTDFATAYPGAPAPLLDYTGGLSNSGERITLDLSGTTLDTVAYTDSAPWPLAPDGDGPSLELIDPLVDNDAAGPWAASSPAPTPGAINSQFGLGPQPAITDLTVGTVAASSPISISAQVANATSVSIEVTVGSQAAQTVPMLDDGANQDGAAGDGRFGAVLPGRPANTLIRYRVIATGTESTVTVPDAGDSRPRLGFVVAPPAPTTPLPVLQWFIEPEDLERLLANRFTNDYVPATVAYGTEVWDGAEVRVQGNVRFVAKVSFKFKMPNGHDLVAPGLVPDPVDEFVIDSDRADPLGATIPLALSAFADGNPYVPQHAKVRVHRNGAFLGLFTFLEEYEDNWMSRAGLSQPGGEVYEPQDTDGVFIDEGSPEALVPRFEKLSSGSSYANLYELVQAIDSPPTAARAQRLRDLFDTPALVDYLAVSAVLQHWDQTVHNFLVVRDPATGRWRFVPTDLDNSLGLQLTSATSGTRVPGIFPFGPDSVVSALRTDPVFNEMYFRRLRTLADKLLAGGVLQQRGNALAAKVAQDVVLDRQKWAAPYTQAQAKAQLTDYLADRRKDVLVSHRKAGEVPTAPTAGRRVVVSELAYAAPGGGDHDFVELHNPSATESIDLSGWVLSGAATSTLPSGTVLPADGYLIVPGDQVATNATRPSGTLVAGAIEAGLADGGGTLQVRDAGGTLRGEATYGTSGAWPAAPAAGTATLELKDPRTAGTGPSSWRASGLPGGSPGVSGNPSVTPGANSLAIEAAADQSEVKPGDGAGAAFTVVVRNTGTNARSAVTVTAPSTTCGRNLGTLAKGASRTFRCSATASSYPDRSFRFTATSGSVTAAAAPVQVRTLIHSTQFLELHLPAAPGSPSAAGRADGTLAFSWKLPPATGAPRRWAVVTTGTRGRAAPSGGTLVAPGTGTALSNLPLDVPVQLAVAVRNRSGTGPRTAPTPWLTPRSTGHFPFATPEALIRGIYADLDGRQPTAQEIAIWQAALAGGTAPGAIVVNRLAEPRWASEVEPITRLYAAYFGRLPDQAGQDYWIRRRRTGATLDQVSASFAATSEFRTRFGALTNRAFVEQVYRNVFDRSPDASGLSYWTRRLDAGRSRGGVMTAFSESSEGKRRLAPLVQTSLVWTAMTGTTPAPDVADPAIGWLRGGGAVATVAESVRTTGAYPAT